MQTKTFANTIRRIVPTGLFALHSLCIANDVAPTPEKKIPCTLEVVASGRIGLIEVPLESGAPFIAEAHHRNDKLVDDKLQPGPEQVHKFYRDSMGRVRDETLNADGSVEQVELRDPVAGVRYSLYGPSEDGFVTALKAKSANEETPIPEAELPKNAEILCRSLGTRQFDGISANGESVHFTLRDRANDQVVLEAFLESWYAPALKVLIFGTARGMKFINFYKKLTHIEKTEPAPALFQPRSGAKIRKI
ncbi:hypothetical protein [Undibacterium sp. TJN19]|uniref:hypothetical protein n=1 Tax=Undibacterium sp. TJN19 TaxID=3413055 RepID=UPI003BF39E2E